MFSPRQRVRIKSTGEVGEVEYLYLNDAYKVRTQVGYFYVEEGDLEPVDSDDEG